MKKTLVLIGVVIAIAIIAFAYYSNSLPALSNTPNEIKVTDTVGLSPTEKDEVVASVDAFMTEYKLPKGVQNSYDLLIERRLRDVLQVTTNPAEPKHDYHAIIYLRKTDGVWQVDPTSGPWCTLEQFEQRDC